MEFSSTIAAILGRGYATPPPKTTHKWNHLLGVELELENVTTPGGGSVYDDDLDFQPSEDYDGDWDDLEYEEQDRIREDWYARNSSGCPAGWTLHSDASLRNGIEFVTSPPIAGTDMEDRIDAFYDKPLNYDGGPRTSTHIHVDVLNDNPIMLQSLVMLVYTIEDALYNAVDEGRKWAGYSMALAEMPTIRLRNLLNPPNQTQFVRAINVSQNRERYYGLNFNVARHGTVEFRYFPGAPSKQELTEWVDLVVLLKNTALAYNPEQLMTICNNPSTLEAFLLRNLSYWGNRFISNVGSEHLFRMFEEVSAFRSDESNPERPSSIVKIQAPLYSVIVGNLLADCTEAKDYLTKAGIPNNIMSLDDANYFMSNARAIADKASIKKKVKVAQVEAEEPAVVVGADLTHQVFSPDSGLFAPPSPDMASLYSRYHAIRRSTSSIEDTARYVPVMAPTTTPIDPSTISSLFTSTNTPMPFDIESYEDPF